MTTDRLKVLFYIRRQELLFEFSSETLGVTYGEIPESRLKRGRGSTRKSVLSTSRRFESVSKELQSYNILCEIYLPRMCKSRSLILLSFRDIGKVTSVPPMIYYNELQLQ